MFTFDDSMGFFLLKNWSASWVDSVVDGLFVLVRVTLSECMLSLQRDWTWWFMKEIRLGWIKPERSDENVGPRQSL